MLPLVAIVGRPNVGKSTLFNRMVGRRTALVADEPGMTRDRHYATVEQEGRTFQLVDTGGFEPDVEAGLVAQIAVQTRVAIEEADVILLLLDVREGATATDVAVVEALRPVDRPVIFVANKVDGAKQEALVGDLYRLGTRRIIGISAEHALGLDELIDALIEALPAPAPAEREGDAGSVRVALVGRPNAGKSALLNHLLGEDRAIVSDVPGTTRDPIDARIETEHGPMTLVDTAGMRRRRRAGPALEQLATMWSARRIESADVACLLIDADAGLAIQDARIASQVMDTGRALVIVFTKSDLVGPPGPALKRLRAELVDRLPFVAFAPVLLLSAKSGHGIKRLIPTIARAHRNWQRRLPTAELNRFLEQVLVDHTPPTHRGRPVRLYFITQPEVAPPLFVLSTNQPDGIGAAFRRYLARRLRESFGFEGSPLRLRFRQHRDPGAKRASRRPKRARG